MSCKTTLYSDRDVTVSLIFERMFAISKTGKKRKNEKVEMAKFKYLG